MAADEPGSVHRGELATRGYPRESIEQTWALNRPPEERPPLPQPGQQVWFRAHEWDHDHWRGPASPQLVTVVEVQPVDDRSLCDAVPGVGPCRDRNLWHLIRDHTTSRPLYGPDGDLLYRPCRDPWPYVLLRDAAGRVHRTREARLRGSAGWLPLDYQTRPERGRLPAQTEVLWRQRLAGGLT